MNPRVIDVKPEKNYTFPYKFCSLFQRALKTPCCRLWFAIFPCEFGFACRTLTHVCVLKVRFYGQVTLVLCTKCEALVDLQTGFHCF